MRIVVQRVSAAEVSVHGQVVGRIEPGPGLLVLAGFEDEDKEADLDWTVRKLIGLRIFPDDQDVMNLSVCDAGG